MNQTTQKNGDVDAKRFVAWIAEGGSNSEKGAEGLFRLYASRLKAFFRRHQMSDAEAADLLQETFIKVIRSASTFRADARVSTWLWTIARNCMIDHVRASRQLESLDELLEEGREAEFAPAVSSSGGDADVEDCVRRGFDAFADAFPERANAIRLAAVEGWSMEELAAYLGRTQGAVREYLSQCRKKLRAFLDPCRDLVTGA